MRDFAATLSGVLEAVLTPVSNAPLILFRWCLGAALACFGVVRFRVYEKRLCTKRILLGFELTRFLPQLPQRYVKLFFVADIVTAMAFAAGIGLPWTALLLLGLRAYVLLINRAGYTNHDYLICLLLFLYCIIDTRSAQLVPRWQLLIVQLQIIAVYFFGGVAKLNADWLWRAMPLRNELAEFKPTPHFGRRFLPAAWSPAIVRTARHPLTAYVMSWGGMLFDLSIGFLLLDPRARPYALVPFFGFHLFNHWFYGLGVFPYLNYASALLFVGPPFYDSALFAPPFADASPSAGAASHGLIFFLVYVAIQLVVPMRRQVATLLGRGRIYVQSDHHRFFSWTMKLSWINNLACEVKVFDRRDGRLLRTIALKKYLTFNTYMHVVCSPRALIMLIARLEPVLSREPSLQGVDFGIRARLRLAYNGRPPVETIDPTADLRGERVRIFTRYPWQRLHASDPTA